MSADEHLSPVQFSQEKDLPYPLVSASIAGKTVGELSWATGHKYPWDNINGQIQDVHVAPEHRRKGIATGMLKYARGIDPSVKHSPDQTEDGQEWAESRP